MDRGAEIGTIPEEAFSFDGYQVVRGEFFAHTFEPSITFCGSKLYVNMACLNKLPTVEYIQILVNQDTKKLVMQRLPRLEYVRAIPHDRGIYSGRESHSI